MNHLGEINYKVALLVLLIAMVACGETVKKEGVQKKEIETNQNHVKSQSEKLTVDGDLSDWPQTPFLSTLKAPWEDGKSDITFFNCYTLDQHFYFYFNTVDTTLTTFPFEEELSVIKGDRVELFFSETEDLSKDYYCIEMDPNGKVLDYKATFYRKFEEAWNFKSTELVAVITENGYLVEGKIAWEELRSLGIGENFYLGIFKADYNGPEQVTWYSWVVPDSEEPDFHIASAFRNFEKRVKD
jgi:hypothetical protein